MCVFVGIVIQTIKQMLGNNFTSRFSIQAKNNLQMILWSRGELSKNIDLEDFSLLLNIKKEILNLLLPVLSKTTFLSLEKRRAHYIIYIYVHIPLSRSIDFGKSAKTISTYFTHKHYYYYIFIFFVVKFLK